jgi:2-keto-3-deoxy-L-rhamnonate aldolase RhmA
VFVKTPHPAVVEILALSALDCLVLDCEHAPFDRAALDLALMAARAGGKPAIVRPQTSAPEHILSALDGGAAGLLLPHIRSADEARAAVTAAHYGPGGRGFAGATRAAGFGARSMAEHLARSAEETAVIAQIEDVEGLEAVEEIAGVAGLDALFIGRADLTIALGLADQDDPRVVAAVERVCAAGRAAGRTVGMFLARAADVGAWRAKGATLFLLSSDHAFLRSGADALARTVHAEL